MNYILETDRLYFRAFSLDDIEPFSEICANPNVMRYIGDGKPADHESITKKIEEWIQLYEKNKFGLMAIVIKNTNKFIGFCGLMHQTVEDKEYIELGYRLDESYWGRGLATEAAIAVRDYAFKVLEIPLLISIIHYKNEASKRVAKKVGMTFMKQTNYKGIVVDVFSLTK